MNTVDMLLLCGLVGSWDGVGVDRGAGVGGWGGVGGCSRGFWGEE